MPLFDVYSMFFSKSLFNAYSMFLFNAFIQQKDFCLKKLVLFSINQIYKHIKFREYNILIKYNPTQS